MAHDRQLAKREAKDDDAEDEQAVPATPIVVSARRLDAARTSIDQGLGATVYELHNETIETRPGGETGSIGAILAQTPGVTLSSEGPNIRGSSAVQVLINGVIVPEAISDPADRLSSRLAGSTRTITGTLPAQFGFAPGGVIAVTTKNGLYQHGGEGELFAGNHGAFEPAVEFGASTGGSSLFASGSLETADARVAGVTGSTAIERRREIGGLAFADHIIDDGNRISLILGGSTERRKIGQTDLPRGAEETSNFYAVGTFQRSREGFTLQTSLFAGHAVDSADFAAHRSGHRGSLGTQVDGSLETSTANTIRGGMLLNHSTSAETRPALPGLRRTSLGVYFQDEWKPAAPITLNVGVRADWLRSFDDSPMLEPRASAVWAAGSGFSAHVGYARYAAAPRLGEEPHGVRLDDETDDYFDAGLQQKLGLLTIGLDAYYRHANNLISEQMKPGNEDVTAFTFARGRFHGVEVSATYAEGPVTAWANLSISKSQAKTIIGGATLFRPVILAATDSHWIDLAADRPITASAGITWRVGKLGLSADVIAGSGAVRTSDPSDPNGSRATPFAAPAVSGVYHLDLFGRPLDVRLDLTNLTDVHYITADAANIEGGWTRYAAGRSILLGFEKSF